MKSQSTALIAHSIIFAEKFTRFLLERGPLSARRGGGAALLAILALTPAGCSDSSRQVQEEVKERVAARDPEAAVRRAEREEEFKEVVKDPLRTPVEEPVTQEKAPPEAGYGEKSEVQILRENPRQPRIGVLAPLTGELQDYGIETSNGVELASDEFDAKGGIKKQAFELLVYDTRGKIKDTQMGVDAFLDRSVLAVVGAATGEVSFSANKAINEGQLIMISAGSRRRLGDTGPYNFRNTLDDVQAVRKLMDYAADKKGWKRFAVFSSLVNDYSIKLTASFKGAIFDRGLELSHDLAVWDEGTTYMTEADTSIALQLEKLRENTPDALIYTGEAAEAAEIVTELRKLGLKLPIIGTEDIMAPEFTEAGEKAAGTLVYSGFNKDSADPRVQAFVKKYTERFGNPPGRLAALGYDAYYILAAAVEKAESLRPSHVRRALLSIKDFHGVTGKTSFTEDGEAEKEPYIFEFGKKSDGKYDFVCIKEPA